MSKKKDKKKPKVCTHGNFSVSISEDEEETLMYRARCHDCHKYSKAFYTLREANEDLHGGHG
jgi:hypothetical protein